jgi:hypothetical protein
MAPRLAVRAGRIVLVEASGTRIKPAHHRSFFEAEQIDEPRHAPTELYRRRVPGGCGEALHFLGGWQTARADKAKTDMEARGE